MFLYVSIYMLLSLLALLHIGKGRQGIVFLFLYMFFVLFVGTRLETGCDFYGYLVRFNVLGTELESFAQITEPGYYLLSYLVKSLGLGFVWVNFFGALIFFYFYIRFAKNHPNPFLLIALMFPLLVIQLSMSGLRQAIAVAFLMGALDSFFKGRRLGVVLYILVGSTFHQSAIILLPIALMVGRTYSLFRTVVAIMLLMPVATYLLSDRLEVYQDRYLYELYGEMSSGGAAYRLGLLVITSLLFEVYRKRMEWNFPHEYNLMRLFSLVSFALIPVLFVNTVALHRLVYYVIPVQLFTLAALPTAMYANRRMAMLAELGPIALYGTYILVWFYTSYHANVCYVPYNSYLF